MLKLTAEAARSVYGVIVSDGVADPAATTAERDQHRARRRERSQVPGETRGQASLAARRRLDDNLVAAPAPGGSGTIVACRHCAEILGGSDPGDTLALARYEGPSAEAGPQIIADPADYVDAQIVFRQYCCPSCWTALYSAVVPADHIDTVTSLGRLIATPAPSWPEGQDAARTPRAALSEAMIAPPTVTARNDRAKLVWKNLCRR